MSTALRWLCVVLTWETVVGGARADDGPDELPAGAVARLSSTRFRHPGGINAMALLPDGKAILTAGGDGTVRVWDAATGKELRQFGGFRSTVQSIALSRDGKRLAVGSVRSAVFEVATGKELGRVERGLSYSRMSFLNDDCFLAGQGGLVHFYDASAGNELRSLRVEPILQALAVSPDGKVLAAGNLRGTIQILDVETGKPRRVFKETSGGVYTLAFSPDGKTLASAAPGGSLRLWDVSTGKPRLSVSAREDARVLAFSSDGRFLATGHGSGAVRVWHADSGRLVRTCTGHGSMINGLAFAPDGATLYTTGDGAVRVWDMGLAELKGDPGKWQPAPARERNPQPGHAGQVGSAAFTPDGRVLLTLGVDRRLFRWDAVTGRLLGECKDFAGRSARGGGELVVMPGGRSVLVNYLNGTLLLCDAITGKELRRGTVLGSKPDLLRVSPGGRTLAVASGWDYKIHLHDAATLRPLRRWAAHHDGISGLAFAPNGKTLASASADRTLRVWDVATAEERLQIGDGPIEPGQVVFSPDGRTLATGGGSSVVHLWDALTGKARGQLRVPTIQAQAFTFSPDGHYLAASYKDGVTLWEAASGQEVVRFRCDESLIRPLVFAPDGRTLASGGQTVLLWDVTGRRGAEKRAGADPSAAELEALWEELAAHDAGRAHRALWGLTEAGRPAATLLARRLDPAKRAEERLVRQWLEKLASTDRPTRREAEAELEAMGDAIEPLVRRVRETTSSAEVYARAEQWLQGTSGLVQTARVLRELRAVAVLERIAKGTAGGKAEAGEARRLLERLAGGEPRARLTLAARSALGRREQPDPEKEPAVAAAEKDPASAPAPPPARVLRQFGETSFGPHEQVVCVAFRPKSTTLALAVTDNTVRLWDAPAHKELRRWPAPVHAETPLGFSPDGKVLFAGGPDGTLRRWDTDAGKELSGWRGHEGRVLALALSADGKRLASGCERGVVVWDAGSGKPSWRADVRGGVSGLAFSPNGKTLAGCSGDAVRGWEAAGGKETWKLPGAAGAHSLAFSPDGKQLWARGPRGDAVQWDVAAARETMLVPGYRPPVRALALSPDGKWVVAGLATGQLLVSDMAPRRMSRALIDMGPVKQRGHPDPDHAGEIIVVGEADVVTTLSFTSDGKYLAAGTGRRVRLFDMVTFTEIPPKATPLPPVVAVAFSADGRSLVAVDRDHHVRTWDPRTGKLLRTHAFGPYSYGALVLSAKGNLMALSGGRRDRKIVLRRTVANRESERLLDPRAQADEYFTPYAMALSPDGTLLAAVGSREIRLLELATGKRRRTIQPGRGFSPRGMAFSADGRTLAITGVEQTVGLFDVVTGKPLPLAEGRKADVGAPVLSPDGGTVYAAYGDEAFCQWEVASGKFRGPLMEVPEGVGLLALSPDGRTLVAARRDHALHFWDARTGRPLGRLRTHTAAVRALAFSPDGSLLASAGDDGTVLVWELAPHRDAPAAERRAEELAALWDELNRPSALRARRAMLALEQTGEQAVVLFERHLRPAGGPDAKRFAGLLADLDNDAFAVRERASRELERLGEAVRPALQRALEGRPSVEARRRIERLLALPSRPPRPPDRLPALRALEVLEHLGTPRARRLVESLAGGDPGDLLTREAQAARDRLAGRSARVP